MTGAIPAKITSASATCAGAIHSLRSAIAEAGAKTGARWTNRPETQQIPSVGT